MDKHAVLLKLSALRHRLVDDVAPAYSQRGKDFGQERFSAWRREIDRFLDENFPGKRKALEEKLTHYAYTLGRDETDYSFFMRYSGNPSIAFIDSLEIDIKNDEVNFETAESSKEVKIMNENNNSRVFIVHGHDETMKQKTARLIEKLGFKPIILHEQANKGQTIIEKIESYTDVGFAIVLYTEDDLGNHKESATRGDLKARARQNVIFEHGYLIAKLGRSHVVPLIAGKIEIPSDISGVVYIEDRNWELNIAREMHAAGYKINLNLLFED